MGADLIGFLVRGPVRITKTATKRAKSRYWADCAKQHKAREFWCPECGTRRRDNEQGPCDNCGTQLPVVPGTEPEAHALVQRLADGWPPEFRDVASRRDPDNARQILVFAGDMSWGDTPAGSGYRYLEKLITTGIGRYLGIR